jgi:hypothetical protein
MKNTLLILLSIFLVSSCGNSSNEDGFLIKYQVCDISSNNCKTMVKFKSLEDCGRYMKFDTSYCDETSVPGKIICDLSNRSKISTSYCR